MSAIANVQDPGELFRTAANNGKVDVMLTLYRTYGNIQPPKLDISAPGPTSGKTAGHRAAAKGHASALRLLHSLGDTFEQKDNGGCTPEQLTSDPKCKQVFALAAIGRKVLAIVFAVFPKPIFVDRSLTREQAQQFGTFRNMKMDLTKELCLRFRDQLTASLIKEQSEVKGRFDINSIRQMIAEESVRVTNLIDNYYTLEGAQKCGLMGGACGELTDVGFAYLTAVDKPPFSVEQIDIDEGVKKNHAFLALNRCEGELTVKGFSEALLIDTLAAQTFFYQNINHISHPCIKDLSLEKWSLTCSNKEISKAASGLVSVQTLAMVQKEFSLWQELTIRKLEELLKERSCSKK